MGVAALFSTFTVALIILPCASLAIFRPFVWREWFLVLFGFLLPVFYYVAVLFMVKNEFYFEFADDMPPNQEFGFTIDPSGGYGEDYDWALYGPDVNCNDL